jgi:KDO2-lipid IV(A) lauroyltransferase
MQAYLIKTLFRCVALLPLSALRRMGDGIGNLLWRRSGREARVTLENLELCFPAMDPQQRELLAAASLRHTAQTALEMIKIWMQPNERSAPLLLGVENEQLIEESLRSPKGLLLLLPHLGNWEMVGLWCARYGQFATLYQPPKQAALEPLIWNARQRLGNKLYPTDTRGVRAVLKELKKGGRSAVLPDQEPEPEGGVFAPFYGVPALTMTLVHGLAGRTDCEVLMAFGKRVAGGFVIVFKEPDPLIKADNVTEAAAALNRSVESCIADCPEQYQWEYKRFKKQPDGAPRRYQF